MIAKYRAKRIDNGAWVYGVPVELDGRCWILNVPRLSYFNEDSDSYLETNQFEVDPATVGQWTGRKDVKGKEIYEGDVYRTNSGKGDAWVVEWIDGGFAFVHARDGDTFMFAERFFTDDEVRITGNIHDNKELMS